MCCVLCPTQNLCWWVGSSEQRRRFLVLHAGEMNEATLYANFMPGYLTFFTYPLPLYKPVYTAHFVQLLLTNWRMGARDMAVSLCTSRVCMCDGLAFPMLSTI